METNYHYYAFISYSTADSKWAKWLQHQLSYYHIPSSVKKSKIGIPNKIRPVFIYEYDLAGNQLHSVIQKELESSKYLIVICSPSAAKSKYVNGEVETFIRMGRSEYIIPFVVDGEVNSTDSKQECFPPVLLDMLRSGDKNNELRGINVKTNGKHQALVDVVATMLGVRRDVLWNRYKMRMLKQRIAMCAIAALAMLCGLFYWDYTRPTYRYYTDYVDVWGVPTGVLELDKNQVRHRNESYRFEYRRIPLGQKDAYSWRLAKVTHINSAGTPTAVNETAYMDRFPIQTLTYSQDNGLLTYITYSNEKGKPQIIHKLSRYSDIPASIVDIESVVAGDGVAFAKSITDLNSKEADKTSNITRYVYERNSDGHIIKVSFHANNSRDFNSSAVADNYGVWGMAYELDSLGRRETIHYLDKDGTIHRNKIGVSARRYEYDSMGNVCSERTFDLKGNLILNEQLWAIAVATFDNYGNRIGESYFDIVGKPCLHNDGFAKLTLKYDDRGNCIEAAYYGIDGNPCLHNDGNAKVTSKYDDRGNRIEEAFYGIDGNPCLHNYGFAKGTYKYDDRGNCIEEAYYGIDGKPCLIQYGYAKCTSKYDDRGNRIEVACYGIDGKPCLHNDGMAKITSKYDDRGNIIEEAYYGIDGNPCLHNDGNAKYTAKYDDRGNIIERAYYGIDGNPCLHNDGMAKITSKYDDRGNRIEAAYYGIDGNPCLDNDGVAKWTFKNDDRGNRTEEACYGIDGNPCLDNDGVAKWTFKNDDRGNRTEEACYGIDGNPCLNNYGFAKWTRKYDDRGNIIEEAHYGIDGNPCLDNDGVAKWTFKNDDRGNRTEEAYYGIDGNPCLNNNFGIAKGTCKYDDRGNIIETAFYGIDDKPCLSITGYSICEMYYCNNLLSTISYYDTERQPVNVRGYFKEERIYDEKNNLKKTIYYDKGGKQLTEQIFTRQIFYVIGAALSQEVPIGSIILQYNEWKIGDTQTSYLQTEKRYRYAEKNVYYLGPTGKIGHIYVKKGLLGLGTFDFMVDNSQAMEWLEQLDEWKRNNQDKEAASYSVNSGELLPGK